MKVMSKEQAWNVVDKLFPTDYEKDEAASRRAGCDIYKHSTLNPDNRICDLGCRLEVVIGNEHTNVWIEEPIVMHMTNAQYNQVEELLGAMAVKLETNIQVFDKDDDWKLIMLVGGVL